MRHVGASRRFKYTMVFLIISYHSSNEAASYPEKLVFRKIAVLLWGLVLTLILNCSIRRLFWRLLPLYRISWWSNGESNAWFRTWGYTTLFTLHLKQWILSLRKKNDVALNLKDRQLPNRKAPFSCRCSLQGTRLCSSSCAVSAKLCSSSCAVSAK